MNGQQMRAVLDIDAVDYKRLDGYVSRTFSGAKKTAAHLILCGLDAVPPSNLNKTLVKGADKFNGVILYALNHAASGSGIRLSDAAFLMNDSKIRAVLGIGELDYQRLDSYLSGRLSEPEKTAAHVLLRGLDAVPASGANQTLIEGVSKFHGAILDALNRKASDFGVHFSEVSLSE